MFAMNLTPKLAALILIFCITSGCASRPPAEAVDQRLGYTPALAGQYRVDEEWWKIYADEQLDRLVLTALDNNTDYAKTAVRINRALYQANLLGADLLPAFSAGADASATKNTKTGKTVRSFSGESAVKYEVDLWRKLADAASAQEWEYRATEEDRASARLALVNNVVDGYFNLAYLEGAIAETRQRIVNYEKILEVVTFRFRYGKVDGIEPEQAAQSLLAARNSLIDLEMQRKTGMQTLLLLLNLAPDAALQLTFPDLLTLKTPEVDLDVPLAVLANRPDLKAAEYRLQRAFKNVRATQKEWYPGITLGASLSSSSDKARTMFDVPFAMGMVSLNLPFLQWNTVKWNVKISEADYDEVKLDFEAGITTALNEVDTAWAQYLMAGDLSRNMAKKHEHDVKISGYYKTRYELGAGELSDWLNALNTAMESQLSLLQSRYQVLRYENAIYKAMAGRYSRISS